ncbi:MAG: murein biosynthesis integral membrane protein MurJ [Phycisphaerae bacterium]|nr:murein biosynthesis integral membrane protein MurJ [Phycisphaerae bacterium]
MDRPEPDAGDTPGGPQRPSLAAAVRVVSGVTLLSRLGGLAREVLTARVFGDTALGSAFTAGFAIPNMFRRLFGEGALAAAFIPEYAATDKSDPRAAQRFASLTVVLLGLVAGAVTAALELVLLLVLLFAPPDADRTLSIRLVMLMLPFMPCICVAALLSGMLQVHGRFGPASSGPLVLNGFIIVVGLGHVLAGSTGGRATAYALGVATVLSGLTQAVWFYVLLRRHVRWTRVFGDAWERARRMFRRMVPVLVGLGTLQLNSFVDTLVAMWPIWVGPTFLGLVYPLDKSSAVILSAGQRLYQFPLGVFGIAVATAVFPMLSRHADDPRLFADTLRRGVRLALFIAVPASLGLVLVRSDTMGVFFRFDAHGFSAAGVERAALVLLGYAPGIWAYSLNHTLTRAFYARGDTRAPMRVALAMVGFNFALNWGLIWAAREAGLAWSTSVAAALQAVLLVHLCRSRLGVRVFDAATRRAVVRILLVTAGMGLLVWLSLTLVPARDAWSMRVLRLAVATSAGAAGYALLAALFRCEEWGWLVRRDRPGRA